ncbi:MAG: hypothetical protein GW795_14915 [Cyanobacteria bacterium]|nr:hypothetical protein [Cyanobacteria bacterium CG_2015-16_32_12]NCO76869.1 hypothetical protein [Cyanobacteria bacterium CG_2015-22_32_23]NCQ03322.1 hypothetical protein [Cyanobacteria bacterium CG_2015-09_32_10]NCQ43117.1 hypothetical protein [Cyanobacteria bacterium CG_2015-04_32_10]NCS84361.1 hypothetical protein [Cyanobacteria bacterium CG_2015-02_32_10]
MQIKDLSINDFKSLIQDTVKETIEQTLIEYLDDPDFDLNLKQEVKKRLIKSQENTEKGEKGIPLTEVIKQLNNLK